MFFRKSFLRVTATFLAVNMVAQIFAPAVSYALTSGPSQPEVQSFEPVGTTDMVDLFSGDFNYNIPLFELPGPNGGYPFNLIYNAGVTMDQEASWVGLGWNVNPGAITRQMRGLPDEFNGKPITKEQDIRPNVTFGVNAGVGLEVFGADFQKGTGGNPSISFGVRVYYNNYRGVGYTLESGASISTSQNTNTMGAGLGINTTMDSQEGVGLNPSLSLSHKHDTYTNSYNVGIGYNSNSGLKSLSTGYTSTPYDVKKDEAGKITSRTQAGFFTGGSSSISLASVAFTPSMAMPMKGRNLDVQVKFGGHAFGVFGNAYVGGFFNTNYIKDKSVTINGYGYNCLNNSTEGSLLDYNREKDGPLRRTSPNLAIPSMTYDIYSVTGHGVAGMFRPYRYDIGSLHDNATSSDIAGGSVGVDLGAGALAHFGINAAFNYSKTKTGSWEDYNEFSKNQGKFGRYNDQPGYEQFYFKTHGEYTSTDTSILKAYNGDAPLSVELTAQSGTKTNFQAENKFRNNTTSSGIPYSRQSRNQVNNYINGDASKGIYTITPDGMRYEYAQVAQNSKQIECQFSVDINGSTCIKNININKNGSRPDYKAGNNTDKYFNRTTYPDFPYAYLLSAVYGSDYVDVDGDGKPSNADQGYWVKFTYDRKEVNYKWKAPYNGANYMKGSNATKTDDKGSYIYGEKEVYYLSKAETRTHEAVFSVSQRRDAKGVNNEMHNASDGFSGAASQYKLDRITLYTKAGGANRPIKTVNFAYTYALCGNVQNNDGLAAGHSYNGVDANQKKGKLTLKKVWFTYQTSKRGELSPYVFDYHEGVSGENPDYNAYAYDRWGNYKSDTTGSCESVEMPYVNQTDPRSDVDRNMSAWNLKSITLPSGANMDITYEADDYAYVQNKIAGQMFKIASLTGGMSSSNTISHERWAGDNQRRVYFQLEQSVSATAPGSEAKLKAYFDGISKLYYRVKMRLRTSSEAPEDYISGYANIIGWGYDEDSKVSGNYTRAFVTMGRPNIGSKTSPFHPFSVAAWQHLRVNEPQLTGIGPYDADPNSDAGAAAAKVQSLTSIYSSVVKMFIGFNENAYRSNWGNTIDLKSSVIRLNTPDKIKYGGGCRVKKIEMSDNWNRSSGETNSLYGQAYSYTMDEDGKTISSGVAAYEPMIGGDEISLRSAKDYTENIPLKTNNALFFEYPVNESYFPGPGVGYRKVAVRSLATAQSTSEAGDPAFPVGLHGTGMTVHDFYTAKEFPVITAESPIEIREYKMLLPIPLLGQIAIHELTASQGYSIVLNDMHGKPKAVTTYAQGLDNKIGNKPVSWVSYTYNAEEIKADGNPNHSYYKLKSVFPTLVSDDMGSNVVRKRKSIGEEFEIFSDMRESATESVNGGLSFNTELMLFGFIPAAFAVPWPNVGLAGMKCRTAVVNKVIHRAGIITQTQAYNEGSLVTTNNLLYDDQTGRALLTSVTNNYDKPVYNYDIPAAKVYAGMGAASENAGNKIAADFSGSQNINTNPFKGYKASVTGSTANMKIGDEYTYDSIAPKRITYAGKIGNDYYFTKGGTAPSGIQGLTLLRSGNRNHLTASAGKVTALSDPTKVVNRGTAVNCQQKYDIVEPYMNIVYKYSQVRRSLELTNLLLNNDVNNNGRKDFYETVPIDLFAYNIYRNCLISYIISSTTARNNDSAGYDRSYPNVSTFDNVNYLWWLEADGGGDFRNHVFINYLTDLDSLRFRYTVTGSPFSTDIKLLYSLGTELFIPIFTIENKNEYTPMFVNTAFFPNFFSKSSVQQALINGVNNVAGKIDSVGYLETPVGLRFKAITSSGIIYEDMYYDRYYVLDWLYNPLWSRNFPSAQYGYQSKSVFVNIPVTPINNILSTSAGTQNDAVILTDSIGTSGVSKGVWRDDASYVYVDDRKQSSNIDLSKDGAIDNVGLFNWKYATNEGCNGWRKVNTITGYNGQSFETENKDILNRYSAALYGYKNNLSTAVAANTAYNELAFDGFEEYNTSTAVKPKDVKGNLLFATGSSAPATSDYNSKLDRYEVTGKGCNILVPAAIDQSFAGQRALVTGATVNRNNDKSIYGNYLVAGVGTVTGQSNKSVLELNTSECKIPTDSIWIGQVGVVTPVSGANAPISSISGTVAISNTKAHTGKQSLTVNGTAAFEQWNLRFAPGKRYVVSGWVSRSGAQAATYADGNLKLGVVMMNTSLGNTEVLLQPTGDVIEGWQKVEGEFTIPAESTTNVQLKLQSSTGTGYFDDLRIFPSEGNMQSYVYDTSTLKLSATLDNNNYATLYYYDEQGNLFLVKKETERGIQTVQESFGHNAETYAK